MKRRIFTLMLAVAFIFGFTACGEKAEEAAKYDSAAEHLTHAYFETFDLSNIGIQAKIGAKGNFKPFLTKSMGEGANEKYVNFFDALLNESEVEYVFKYASSEGSLPMFSAEYGLVNNGKDLINVDLFSDSENLGIKMPALSSKGFVVSYSKIASKILESASVEDKEGMETLSKLTKLDLKKYKKIVLGDKEGYDFYVENFPKYKELIDAYINETYTKTDVTTVERDGKTIDVTEYKMAYDWEKNINLMIAILNQAKEDEALRNMLVEKAGLLIDEFISSKDYEAFDMTEEEAKKIKADFEAEVADKEALAKKWSDSIQESIDVYENEGKNGKAANLAKDADFQAVVRIDANNHLDSAVGSIKVKPEGVEEAVEVTVDGVYLQNVEVEKAEGDDYYNLDALLDVEGDFEAYMNENPAFFDFTKGFAMDVVTTLTEGESFAHIYELMKSNGLEQEEAMIQMYLQQAKTMIEGMTQEQFLQMGIM